MGSCDRLELLCYLTDAAMKMALLMSIYDARLHEMRLVWQHAGVPVPAGINLRYDSNSAPAATVTTRFVQEHKLQPLLIGVLDGQTWPELSGSEAAVSYFLRSVEPLLLSVGSKADARRLEAQAEDPHSLVAAWPAQQAWLAVLATKLDNDSAEEILLHQVKRLPEQALLYSALIEHTGVRHRDLITTAYQHTPNLCPALVRALGQTHDTQVRALLREYFAGEDLTPELTETGHPTMNDYTRFALLSAFADAADMLNHGNAVVSHELLQQCELYATKNVDQDAIAARLKALPAARAQAIKLLQEFYQA